MGKFIKDFSSFLRGVILFLFTGASIVSAATCMNYGSSIGKPIYLVVGILALIFAGYAAYMLFKKFFV